MRVIQASELCHEAKKDEEGVHRSLHCNNPDLDLTGHRGLYQRGILGQETREKAPGNG